MGNEIGDNPLLLASRGFKSFKSSVRWVLSLPFPFWSSSDADEEESMAGGGNC